MLPIPATEFFMGRVPDDQGIESGRMVRVDAFFLDKLEVTAEQYARCVAAGECTELKAKPRGCTAGRSELAAHPINCVDWYEADRYCRAQGKRLPTDTEWELAARGTDRRTYPWGNDEPGDQLCRQGRKKLPSSHTCPVGSFPEGASPFGALDMAGNVAEWTATEAANAAGRSFVAKGGGFPVDELESPELRDVRADSRDSPASYAREVWLGFRCAKQAQ
jgi:formylglycine-generating enzyme required for sulfatase activity